MEFWQIATLYVITHLLIQLGMTVRRIKIENSKKERLEIIESNKLKRIDKLASLDYSKMKVLSNYENKDSSLRSE